MHRRSAVGRMAGALAALSVGQVPSLEAEVSANVKFSVTPEKLPRSPGLVTCRRCQEMADSLELTPAGLCLVCADRSPEVRLEPHSDRFWTLSPRDQRRLEREIERLSATLQRMNTELAEETALEAGRDRWLALQRELHLLHLLRAASLQFRP